MGSVATFLKPSRDCNQQQLFLFDSFSTPRHCLFSFLISLSNVHPAKLTSIFYNPVIYARFAR